jgi:hypothetical protein
VLRVSELEGLYCLSGVLLAVARHLGLDGPARLAESARTVRKQVSGALLHKLALERTKRALRHRLAAVIDVVTPDPDYGEVERRLEAAIEPTHWSFDPKTVLGEEKTRLETALGGDWDADLLPLIPGKLVLGVVADTLSVGQDVYKEMVLGALGESKAHAGIRDDIVNALQSHLPPRTASAPPK